ncbi:polysaccharide pyruvyl transferase family protein [Exiguobacterium sp. SH0S2]|uniref:polysaccharide pyruvyl transferase family protein n=1 Tax=Exiguobacterium sp. SH0S2 TaxID=2510950 RepID=UPI0013762F7F|nr:polysaccharide pyruvyl transferase family protein [Exiguobacterium sp. SH0S2]
MNINILGAFDRNNYGDLLFPIVLEKHLLKRIDDFKINFKYYGLRESDLTEFGAKITQSIYDLSHINNEVIILAGGETLGTTWFGMDACFPTDEKFKRIGYRILHNKLGKSSWVNKKIMSQYSVENIHPWLPQKSKIKSNNFIVNAVGGSDLSILTSNELDAVRDAIWGSKYFAVRDEQTLNSLKDVFGEEITKKVKLVPDTVVAMDSVFSKQLLQEQLSEEARFHFSNNNSKEYFVFQISEKVGNAYFEKIYNGLYNYLKKNGDIDIILLPIGRAEGHSDHRVLERIKEKLKREIDSKRVFLPKSNTIFDTAYYIANSNGYTGTSLHGAITAIAYEVPHAAFSEEILKLVSFLKTWQTTPIINIEVTDIEKGINSLLGSNVKVENINKMKEIISNHFDELAQTIGDYSTKDKKETIR